MSQEYEAIPAKNSIIAKPPPHSSPRSPRSSASGGGNPFTKPNYRILATKSVPIAQRIPTKGATVSRCNEKY